MHYCVRVIVKIALMDELWESNYALHVCEVTCTMVSG